MINWIKKIFSKEAPKVEIKENFTDLLKKARIESLERDKFQSVYNIPFILKKIKELSLDKASTSNERSIAFNCWAGKYSVGTLYHEREYRILEINPYNLQGVTIGLQELGFRVEATDRCFKISW